MALRLIGFGRERSELLKELAREILERVFYFRSIALHPRRGG